LASKASARKSCALEVGRQSQMEWWRDSPASVALQATAAAEPTSNQIPRKNYSSDIALLVPRTAATASGGSKTRSGRKKKDGWTEPAQLHARSVASLFRGRDSTRDAAHIVGGFTGANARSHEEALVGYLLSAPRRHSQTPDDSPPSADFRRAAEINARPRSPTKTTPHVSHARSYGCYSGARSWSRLSSTACRSRSVTGSPCSRSSTGS